MLIVFRRTRTLRDIIPGLLIAFSVKFFLLTWNLSGFLMTSNYYGNDGILPTQKVLLNCKQNAVSHERWCRSRF